MLEIVKQLTSIPAPFNMIVIVVLVIMTAFVIADVIKQVGKYAVHRQEIELKRELLDRGMTAEEIERVVRAHSPRVEKRASDPLAARC